MKPSLDKFRGCLVGLAVGDALGMPFEGWRPHWIKAKVGEGPLGFLPARKRALEAGMWTDDTKMALALARSIVRGGGVFSPAAAAREYLAWFRSGDLRGIGGATLESLTRVERGISWEESGKTGAWAAGNGTAMRAAPIGLIDCTDMKRLAADSRADAIITHNNPEAIAGSRAVNFIVARGVTSRKTISAAIIDETIEFIGPCRVAERLQKAKGLLKERAADETALSKIGSGGYVVETVAAAVYCVLRHNRDFGAAVSAAVRAGGDTDTTAAVAGAISGAWLGYEKIPGSLRERVEDSEKIAALAKKIQALAT